MAESSRKSPLPGDLRPRFAYAGLDRLIHEKARLAILMALLSHAEGLAFRDLCDLCDLSDGNLYRHVRALAAQKLIDLCKSKVEGERATVYRLTPNGRERLLQYVNVLRQVAADADRALRRRF